MLPRLRGMFAFAIWDTQTRELFMARDPTASNLSTTSRPKTAFFSLLKSKRCWLRTNIDGIEPAGLAGFYLWGSVPEPWTLFRDVFALPAGHCLRVRAGVADPPVCWHDIRANGSDGRPSNASELQERVREAVKDSVRAHLVADVPVSVFLSGGIDSAAIAGLAAELGANVEGSPSVFRNSPVGMMTKCPLLLRLPRTMVCRTMCAWCPAANLPRTCRAFSMPWISPPSTG